MSYSEAELKQLSWSELARLLDMTTIQRNILVNTLALAQTGNTLADWHMRRFERHCRDFAFWLKQATEEPPGHEEPNAGLMLAHARVNCDQDISLLYGFLEQQPGSVYYRPF